MGILGGRLPFEDGASVHVLGASPGELLAGAPVAIALHLRRQLGALEVWADGPPGPIDPAEAGPCGAMAEWWAQEEVTLARASGELTAPLLVLGGPERLRPDDPLVARAVAADPDATIAIAGLGAEAARGEDPRDARRRLVALAAHGGLLHAEPVLRFGAAGRAFVELIENVHHRLGPDGQLTAGDAVRAALFGREGRVPVNLATREVAPDLDLTTHLVFFVAAREIG